MNRAARTRAVSASSNMESSSAHRSGRHGGGIRRSPGRAGGDCDGVGLGVELGVGVGVEVGVGPGSGSGSGSDSGSVSGWESGDGVDVGVSTTGVTEGEVVTTGGPRPRAPAYGVVHRAPRRPPGSPTPTSRTSGRCRGRVRPAPPRCRLLRARRHAVRRAGRRAAQDQRDRGRSQGGPHGEGGTAVVGVRGPGPRPRGRAGRPGPGRSRSAGSPGRARLEGGSRIGGRVPRLGRARTWRWPVLRPWPARAAPASIRWARRARSAARRALSSRASSKGS